MSTNRQVSDIEAIRAVSGGGIFLSGKPRQSRWMLFIVGAGNRKVLGNIVSRQRTLSAVSPLSPETSA